MNDKIMENNYHCHTFRCGHAYGADEQFVKEAIKNGFKILGFSDHIFLKGFEQPGMRGSFAKLEDYVASMRNLKEKYKDQIDIKVGFEAEWYGDRYREYYEWLLSSGAIEYLILGNHMTIVDDENGNPKGLFYGSFPDKKLALKMYTDTLIEGMESGLFAYVAHPDFFHYLAPSWNEDAENAAKRIIEAAIKLDMPLEINMVPSRALSNENRKEENLIYPWAPFWDLASKYGAKCILGVDAHNPGDFTVTDYSFFDKFIERHKLNLVKRLDVFDAKRK